jgi:hypothetical protein
MHIQQRLLHAIYTKLLSKMQLAIYCFKIKIGALFQSQSKLNMLRNSIICLLVLLEKIQHPKLPSCNTLYVDLKPYLQHQQLHIIFTYLKRQMLIPYTISHTIPTHFGSTIFLEAAQILGVSKILSSLYGHQLIHHFMV